uniref:Uncharacterized protein n=1 Tax=Plectus sambesii TaxID=2011161 RepID=A0A914V883_9BILA
MKGDSKARKYTVCWLSHHPSVNSCHVTFSAQLQCLCDEVDRALAYLQVVSETQLFQERKLDAKFAFALHREAKIAEITETKALLTKEHQTRMQAKQKKQVVELEEKQRLFQNAFEHDLQLYKTTGLIANTIASMESPADALTTATGQLNVDDMSQLANVLATSEVHAADTPFAQMLLNRFSLPTRTPRQPSAVVDLEHFGPLTPEEDEINLQQFLSDVKLEDSGIAGSD